MSRSCLVCPRWILGRGSRGVGDAVVAMPLLGVGRSWSRSFGVGNSTGPDPDRADERRRVARGLGNAFE